MTTRLPLLGTDFQRRLQNIQEQMVIDDVDAWVIFDHRGRNPIAKKFLGEYAPCTRQYAIVFFKTGRLVMIRPWIEATELDKFVGGNIEVYSYKTINELEQLFRRNKFDRIAMDFEVENPEVDFVPAGRVKFIERLFTNGTHKKTEVVSSQDYIQLLEAILTPRQLDTHKRAATACSAIMESTFEYVFQRIHGAHPLTERQVVHYIESSFRKHGLNTSEAPIVAVGRNTADPHHSSNEMLITRNQLILIDIWAKYEIYADMTWMGYTGSTVPMKIQSIFDVLIDAQSMGIRAAHVGQPGYMIDQAVRNTINEAGYADFFTHRTGHSIDTDVHGKGANLDSYETMEMRRLMPGLVVSVEPGIYLPDDYGLRSELDIIITPKGPEITTKRQYSVTTPQNIRN